MSKNYQDLAVDLVKSWLEHESSISFEAGRTTVAGESISVKEVAQAYLDLAHTISHDELPEHMEEN